MYSNIFGSGPYDMDNSFDLISNNDYIKSFCMPPTFSKDEPDSNGLVSLDMIEKNFEFTSSIKQENNICTNNVTNDSNKKLLGRKPKGDQREAKHSKISPDNIIKRIKTYFLDYIHDKLEKNTDEILYKPTSNINENLGRNYNIKLMNQTIREMYEQNPASKKYNSSVNDKKNIYIKKIFDDNKDSKAIEIFNTKYIDFLQRAEAKDYIYKEIKEEDKESNESYMLKVKEHLEHFEEWFTKKKKRIGKLKKNENLFGEI